MSRPPTGGLESYLRDIAEFPKLPPGHEDELAALAAGGDELARETLIRSKLGLVVHLCKRRKARGSSAVDLADMIGEGNFALIRAVSTYRPGMGYRLGTHVRKHVREALRELVLHASDRRLPYSHESLTQVIAFNRTHESLAMAWGRRPTFDEVADVLGMSENRRVQMRRKLAAQSFGGEAEGGDGSSSAAVDRLPGRESDPSDLAEARELVDRLRAVLDRLDPEDAEAIRLRYGIGCDPVPQGDIARRLRVCPTTLLRVQDNARNVIRQSFEEP